MSTLAVGADKSANTKNTAIHEGVGVKIAINSTEFLFLIYSVIKFSNKLQPTTNMQAAGMQLDNNPETNTHEIASRATN